MIIIFFKFYIKVASAIKHSSAKSRIGDLSSNPGLVCCVHFLYFLNGTFSLGQQPVEEKLNFKFQTVEKATERLLIYLSQECMEIHI